MLQGSLFAPPSAWAPPRLGDLPSSWSAFPRIGLDTETRDEKLRVLGPGVRRGGYVVGFSLAFPGLRSFYVPLRHLGGDNVEDPEAAVRYLRHHAATYAGEVVGARLSYDLDYLAEMGVEFPLARFRDVQVAEPLLDELQVSYSLEAILRRHGLEGKAEDLLRDAASQFKNAQGKALDPKKDLWMMPARYVGPYAEGDAEKPLQLLERQERLIDERGLRRVWELETDVLPITVKMRRRGVRIDFDQLDRVERFSRAEEAKAWGEVHRHTGVSIRVGDAMKPEVIAPALRVIGVELPTTKTGKPSITKELLEALPGEVGKHIRRARKMSQLRTTFVASVREHAVRGRVHATFKQVVMQDEEGDDPEGARPGRFSCLDPNLQQQPARDPELGPMWRKVYLPDEGGIWGCKDFSQQEPRLAVHYAVVSGPARIGAFAHARAVEAAQRYWDDRTTDAHTMFTQMVYGDDVVLQPDFKKKRDECKQIFLGICYAMGGAKLCRKLGLPTKVIEHWKSKRRIEVAGDEGDRLLKLVEERAPYIKATANAIEEVAKLRGYIVTAGGRHCHFPTDDAGNYDWTHKAFNRAIQGSAADQTKTAMVAIDREGAYIQLQVHDEFDSTLSSVEEGRRYSKVMEDCFPLKVPSKVDLEVGPSWGELKDWEKLAA